MNEIDFLRSVIPDLLNRKRVVLAFGQRQPEGTAGIGQENIPFGRGGTLLRRGFFLLGNAARCRCVCRGFSQDRGGRGQSEGQEEKKHQEAYGKAYRD